MGANTSKVDADLALFSGELEETSTRALRDQRLQSRTSANPTSTQATPLSSHQGSLRTATSSLRTSSRATSTLSQRESFQHVPTSSQHDSVKSISSFATEPTPQLSTVLPKTESATLPEHVGRLPPIESRQNVQIQANQVAEWRSVDDSDDIYESVQIGNPVQPTSAVESVASSGSDTIIPDYDAKPIVEQALIAQDPNKSPQLPRISTSDLIVLATDDQLTRVGLYAPGNAPSPPPSTDYGDPMELDSADTTKPSQPPAFPFSRKRPLPAVPEPQKKRRLVPTQRAFEIADETSGPFSDDYTDEKPNVAQKSEFGFFNPFPDGFPLTEEEEWLLPDPHPGSCLYQDSTHEDEGYWSQVVNTPDSVEDETAEEMVDRQVKILAKPHKFVQSVSHLSKIDKDLSIQLVKEDPLLKQAHQYMLREQEEGAERSRRLRERALQRRGLLEIPSSSSSSEQDKTFSDKLEESSMSDLFSDKEEDEQIEDLLDVAQDYATKNLKIAPPEAESAPKLQIPKSSSITPHPASCAVAEQFRTQTRHFSGDRSLNTLLTQTRPLSSQIAPTTHASYGSPLKEREERLLAAKKPDLTITTDSERRVSNSAFGNRFTRGDFGSRNPRSGSQNANRSLASSPPRREPVRQQRSAGDGPRPRSLIDRFASFLKVDERHDEDDDNSDAVRGGFGALSQPESERTTGKAGGNVIDEHKNDTKPAIRPLSGLQLFAAKAKRQAQDDFNEKSRPAPPARPAALSPQSSDDEDDDSALEESTSPAVRRPDPTHRMGIAAKADVNDTTQAVIGESVRRPAFALALSTGSGQKGHLTLPSNFQSFTEEKKLITVEHEIVKERFRDLNALGNVFWEFARLACFSNRELSDKTMSSETEELHEVGEYITLVLEMGEPGKLKRDRISKIRDNIKRRIAKAARRSVEPTDGAITAEMWRTFTRERSELLETERAKALKDINKWGELRTATNEQRHTSLRRLRSRSESQGGTSTRRQVRFADEEEIGDPDVPPSRPRRILMGPKNLKQPGTATENRRQAQYNRIDKLEEVLRARLKLFETAPPADFARLQGKVAALEEDIEQAKLHEDSDSDSEEDDGADLVFGVGQRASKQVYAEQDLNEINRLEDARQKETGTHATQRAAEEDNQQPDQVKQTQAFDPVLLQKMNLARAKRMEARADPSIITSHNNTVVQSENDSDAESEESSEDDEEAEDRQVFRYTIKGAFRGIEIFEDADHYLFESRDSLEDANEYVAEVAKGVLNSVPRDAGIDLKKRSIHVMTEDDMARHHVILGAKNEIEAEVWIEKELISLEKKKFQQAKRRGVVVERATYVLSWVRTITPIIEDEGPDEIDADCEGYEDLFDFSPEEKAKAREPTITAISQDEIEQNMYTCAVLANRKAKNKYLEWLSIFYPGKARYLTVEEHDLEGYLESLGSSDLFLREDWFERDDEDEMGNVRRVKDNMKVWVRKLPVKGPGN